MRIYIPTILVIIIDQSSKMWVKQNLALWERWDVIGSFLRFSHVRNPGIAFGISVGDYSMLITFLSFAATIVIAYVHWQERNNHPLIVNGLGLILGGAIGNLIDRSYIFFSAPYVGVVDFIDVGVGGFRWYTFNIADTAVTLGIISYFIHSLLTSKPNIVEKND